MTGTTGTAGNGRAVDVVVVGAGVMGSATAFFLATRGLSVAVIEQGRVGGTPGASGASGAMMQALSGEGRALEALGQESRRQMPDLARELYELTGTDVGLTQPGSLVLAFSEAEAALIRSRRVPAYEASGEPMQWLSPEEVRRREPGVAPEVLGGLLLPESHNVYAPQYVKALAHGAGARGATLLEGTVVTGVRREGGGGRGDCRPARRTAGREGGRVTAVETSAGTIPCGAVVLATGAWTGLASRWLGAPLPVGPQRGQILALQSRPPQPPVRHILHGQGGYAIPKPNGTTVLGATHDQVGFDARVTAEGLRWLTTLGQRLVPHLGDASLRHAWCGFRPVMEDGGAPVVGRLPGTANAYVCSGHGAVGVTASPATGRLLAALIAGEGEAEARLAPFTPGRYAGAAVSA